MFVKRVWTKLSMPLKIFNLQTSAKIKELYFGKKRSELGQKKG
jgi:hypothetical protein